MATQGELLFEQPSEETLRVILSGPWKLGKDLPSADVVMQKAKDAPAVRDIGLDAQGLTDWDSGLLIFLTHIWKFCAEQNIRFTSAGLPQGVKNILELAAAVPEKKDARKAEGQVSFLTHVGNEAVGFVRSASDLLEFVGEATVALLRLLRGKAQYRRVDLESTIEACGAQALPIVTLINFLVGMILAFVGAIELKMFGAEIYVANLVGVAMIRLMAAIMTGIVMAGRTGGAFAAQLGTMQVNQEIDALKTLGLSPMEFLVLPRMLALGLMMPLLALCANVMGVLGGAVVAASLPNIGLIQYYHQTTTAISVWDLGIGLFSSAVFGVIVALSGCMRGMQCGRSASAVGNAATSAVVTAIVGITVATAIITFITNILGV